MVKEFLKKYSFAFKVIAILAVPLLVWLGFYREEFFIEMNELIMFKENPEVGNFASEIVAGYYNRTAAELYSDKWMMTVYFTFYFFALSAMTLFLFFQKKAPVFYLIYFYIGLFVLSAISYGSGFITGNQEGAYLVARRLMGLLQSPYPFMLIFVLQFFNLDQKKDVDSNKGKELG